MRSRSSRSSGLSGECQPELIGVNPHVAKQSATGAVLQSEWAGRQLVVVRIDRRLTIQFHDEMASTRRDLVMVPLVARLDDDLRRSHLDDAAGSVCRIGSSIEDVDLV